MSFNDIPIRRKIALVVTITSSAVLLLTGALVILYEYFAFKETLLNHLQSIAQVVANQSTAALTFQDDKAATQNLASLQVEKYIHQACFYLTNGQVFARFPPQSSLSLFPGRPPAEGRRIQNNEIVIVVPVREGQNTPLLGFLFLRSDLAPLYQRIWLYAWIVGLVLLGSLVLGVALSAFFQRRISRPILTLADVAQVVSSRKDYSVRARKTTDDELGTLTDAFNAMLT